MKYVRLEKIAEASNPVSSAADKMTYVRGRVNTDRSLPVAYFMDGWLETGPIPGENLKLFRTVSDGVVVPGFFTSTCVMEVQGDEFTTMNSIYRMTELPESDQIPWPWELIQL